MPSQLFSPRYLNVIDVDIRKIGKNHEEFEEEAKIKKNIEKERKREIE